MSRKLLCAVVLLSTFGVTTHAQEFQRWTGNVGGGLQFPTGNTSRFSGTSGHVVGGIGANLTQHFGVSGEFLWSFLPIKQSVIDQSKLLGAHAFETALTMNGIVRFPITPRLAAYAIGGGGLYHRYAVLRVDQSGTVPAVVCGGLLIFLSGSGCISGDVPTNQVEQKHSSNVLGGNLGAGLNVPVGDGDTKLYLETRYHYAPHGNGSTGFVLLTFGVRW